MTQVVLPEPIPPNTKIFWQASSSVSVTCWLAAMPARCQRVDNSPVDFPSHKLKPVVFVLDGDGFIGFSYLMQSFQPSHFQ